MNIFKFWRYDQQQQQEHHEKQKQKLSKLKSKISMKSSILWSTTRTFNYTLEKIQNQNNCLSKGAAAAAETEALLQLSFKTPWRILNNKVKGKITISRSCSSVIIPWRYSTGYKVKHISSFASTSLLEASTPYTRIIHFIGSITIIIIRSQVAVKFIATNFYNKLSKLNSLKRRV